MIYNIITSTFIFYLFPVLFMKVLFAVWELDPFLKFGGLGDIARSLPAALFQRGVDIRVVIPFYKAVNLGKIKRRKIGRFRFDYDYGKEKVEVFLVYHPDSDVPVYLLRNENYLDSPLSMDTFAFFSKGVVELVGQDVLGWSPQIIHCHDHHTALIPLLKKISRLPQKTLLTIHNLSYQGRASLDVIDRLGIGKGKIRILDWEIKSKRVNFLLEGIIHADIITTVSPSYAREIMTEEYGAGLDELLRGKEGRVYGILNGIDTSSRSRYTNKNLAYPYLLDDLPQKEKKKGKKIYSFSEGKRLSKKSLQKKLGLSPKHETPLFAFIGRFAPNQKGLDILHKMLRRIDLGQYQFVILGFGNRDWENRFEWLAKFYPKSISCNFKYDEVLATQIYAGADFIIIPSKFEPCGLIQMIAMRFGTLPVAHRTGGLKDSIEDDRNGFLFGKYTSYSLESAVKKAVYILQKDPQKYQAMVKTAMKTDFSWGKSAQEYLKLYTKLVKEEF